MLRLKGVGLRRAGRRRHAHSVSIALWIREDCVDRPLPGLNPHLHQDVDHPLTISMLGCFIEVVQEARREKALRLLSCRRFGIGEGLTASPSHTTVRTGHVYGGSADWVNVHSVTLVPANRSVFASRANVGFIPAIRLAPMDSPDAVPSFLGK